MISLFKYFQYRLYLLIFYLICEDLRDLLAVYPKKEGVFLLDSGVGIKTHLLSYLSLYHSGYDFDIIGDERFLIKCHSVDFFSNNIYMYIYNKFSSVDLCINVDRNNVLYTIKNSIKTKFYTKWINPQSVHFDIFGYYNDTAYKNLQSYIKQLPTGSTVLLNKISTNYFLHSLSKELMFASFIKYSANPYVKFLHRIIINPGESTLVINMQYHDDSFTVNSNQLLYFSNSYILNWQRKKICEFTKFFHKNIVSYLHGEKEKEFQYFIDKLKCFSDKYSNITSLNELQKEYIVRYKELLLFKYVSEGNTKVVYKLIENNVAVNCKTSSNSSALHIASSQNDYNMINVLVNLGVDINSRNIKNITPLMLATSLNCTEAVKSILYYKPDINVYDIYGNTAIIISAIHGYTDITNILLTQHPDIYHQNKLGYSALSAACISFNAKIVSLILSYGYIPSSREYTICAEYQNINSIIINFNNNPLKYILNNNYQVSHVIDAFDRIKLHHNTSTEVFMNTIEEIQLCLSELNSNKCYKSLDICVLDIYF